MSKIAFLNRAMTKGGAEKMLAFVIESVAELADEVFLFQFSEEPIEYPLPKKIVAISLKIERKKRKTIFGKSFDFLSRIIQLNKELKKHKIDIICTFGYYYTLMAILARKNTNTKVIASERRSPADTSVLWQKISNICYSNCDELVFQLQDASNFYSNIPEERKTIIPNPYVYDPSAGKYIHSRTSKEVAMAAARLEYVKGFDIGIRAMKIIHQRFPSYKLVIYGKGDFSNMYDQLIRNEGLESVVEYRGHSGNIVNDLLSSEIFLLPSRVEGIPNMLMEAMGVGMPCVAADCPPGGSRLLLGDSKYGLLVAVNDVQGTAQAIISYIENPSLLERMSISATSVRDRFSKQEISLKWQNVFGKLIES